MRINHNIAALNTYRQLTANGAQQNKSLAKLSSGLRINSAADDAAGLAISEKMRAQIRGLDQASRNAQDGISLIQTAEGALSETHSILQRMRELANQAANDTNVGVDRSEIQKEINQLTSEINRIGNTTEFNTQALLKGDFDKVDATAGTVTAGAALAASVEITDTASSGYVTAGAAVAGAVTIHAGTAGSVTGNVDITGGPDITADNNELTVTVGDVTETIALTVNNYTDVTGQGFVDFKTDLQAALDGVFGGGVVTVGDDGSIGGAIDATAGVTTGAINNLANGEGNNANLDLTAGLTNELTLSVDGEEVTVALALTDYSAGANGGLAAFATALETDINAATSVASDITVSIDGDGYVNLTSGSTGATSEINIIGGNMVGSIFGAATETAGVDAQDGGFITLTADTAGEDVSIDGGDMMATVFSTAGDGSDITPTDAEAANNTLTFDLDDEAKSITLTSGDYADADALITEIQARLDAASIDATASNDGSDKIVLTSDAAGDGKEVTNVAGSGATVLGFDGNESYEAGENATNILTLNVDGAGEVDATIQTGTYTDSNVLASAVQSAINTAIAGEDVTVSVDDSGELVITSGTTGSSSTITIGDHATNDAKEALGLTTNTSEAGTDEANADLKFQIGANMNQSMSISISDMRSLELGVSGSVSGGATSVAGATFTTTMEVTDGTDNTGAEYALDVSDHTKAAAAVEVIDSALETVSAERSRLGAYQNRLEHTINNLGTSAENLSSAESRVRDVDMAKEMMEFTKNNILSQAAQAMLAQANQMPQGVLQLLR